MTTAILPRLPDLVGAAAQRLVEVRPSARQHIVAGRWGDPLAQWKAECALVQKRLAAEITAARVSSEGRALYDLLVSEFDAVISPEPSKAVGTIMLTRNAHDAGVTQPGGLIPKGTKFRKTANATSSPPVRGAEYVSVEPVFVPPYPGNSSQIINIRIEASQSGTAANAQPWETTTAFAKGETLFDPLLTVSQGWAAGGSDAFSTVKLRSLAQALALGQYGPTAAALAAGVLSSPGVSRFAMQEYDQNGDRGTTVIWIGDDSWCWSQQLEDTALQTLQDSWLGFGCKATINPIENTRASATASVMLRDKRNLADTLSIADNIRAATKAYFDARPDFYTWRLTSLAATITRSDRRILGVPGVHGPTITVKDVLGNALAEPSASLPTNTANQILHYDLDATKLALTFLTPA